MIKLIFLILLILFSIFFFTSRIIKNHIHKPFLRFFIYGILCLLFLVTILLARFESADSLNGKYTPPYYDGKNINPGIVEYE